MRFLNKILDKIESLTGLGYTTTLIIIAAAVVAIIAVIVVIAVLKKKKKKRKAAKSDGKFELVEEIVSTDSQNIIS